MNQNTHIIGDIVLFLTTKWKIPAHNLLGFSSLRLKQEQCCQGHSVLSDIFLGEYFHLHLHLHLLIYLLFRRKKSKKVKLSARFEHKIPPFLLKED